MNGSWGCEVQSVYLLSIALSLAIMLGFWWFFHFSRHGLAMRATAFDQQVAQSLGISVPQVFAMSWAISAVVSAVAGVVVGVVSGVSSGLSFYGIKVFPGGDPGRAGFGGGRDAGRHHRRRAGEPGAVRRFSQWLNWGNMTNIAPFYALILILMIKPYGLFGTRNIERV